METDEKQVMRNIASVRTRVGHTQESIAHKMGVSKRTIINMENHPFNYTIYKLNDYAKALGVNINEFFLPLNLTNNENE